jgi:hypothetical protein
VKDYKGRSHGQVEVLFLIYLEELRKITSNPVTAAGFLTEIRTEQLPKQAPITNEILERCRYTNLLGWKFVSLHLSGHIMAQSSSRTINRCSPGQEIMRPDLATFAFWATTTMLLLSHYYYYHNLLVIISVIITIYLRKYNRYVANGCVMLVRSLRCFYEPSTLIAFLGNLFIEDSFKVKQEVEVYS